MVMYPAVPTPHTAASAIPAVSSGARRAGVPVVADRRDGGHHPVPAADGANQVLVAMRALELRRRQVGGRRDDAGEFVGRPPVRAVALLAAVDVFLLARLDELPVDVRNALEVRDDVVELGEVAAERLGIELEHERGAVEDAVDQLVVVVALDEALA
jgi:hypothetical protein